MNSELNQNIQQIHSSDDEGTLVRRNVAHNMRKVRLARGRSLRDVAAETNFSTALYPRLNVLWQIQQWSLSLESLPHLISASLT